MCERHSRLYQGGNRVGHAQCRSAFDEIVKFTDRSSHLCSSDHLSSRMTRQGRRPTTLLALILIVALTEADRRHPPGDPQGFKEWPISWTTFRISQNQFYKGPFKNDYDIICWYLCPIA